MRSYAVSLLGLVFLSATPAFAGDKGQADAVDPDGVTHQSSTYTPGPAAGSRAGTVRGYSTRNSAVQTARGGGPAVDAASAVRNEGRAASSDLSASTAATNPHAARGRFVSDNQTRRPGAANYTGSSSVRSAGHTQKNDSDEGRYVGASARGGVSTPSTHSVPEPAGVSMQGDNFAARTGSRLSGPIPTRAPESNERDTRAGWQDQGASENIAPTARGGGPASVRLPDGETATPAPAGPIDYWHADRIVQPGNPSPLSTDDLRALPYPGDGTRRAGNGLLSPRTPDRSRQVTGNPSPLTTSTWEMTRQGEVPGGADSAPPSPPAAIGGGPRRMK